MYACNMTEPPRQKRRRIEGTPQTRGILQTSDLRDIRCMILRNDMTHFYPSSQLKVLLPNPANSPCREIKSQTSLAGRIDVMVARYSRPWGPLSGAALVLCFALVGHDGLFACLSAGGSEF